MRTYRLNATNRDGVRVRVSIHANSQESAMRFATANDLTELSIYDWTPRSGRADWVAYFACAAENL